MTPAGRTEGRTSRSGSRSRKGAVAALFVIALVIAPPASAHGQVRSHTGEAAGLPIPSLTHGQMAVLAGSRDEILALANRQVRTDPVFRRLGNFVALQHAFCLWGLAPGGVTDESSPFNECSHADLAAVRALLLHMLTMPDARGPAQELAGRIDGAMAGAGASLIMCRFSDESFNTADLILPPLSRIPFHAPSLLVLGCPVLFLASGWMLLTARRRGPQAG